MQPDALVGLAFPVIRVRYAGPTDHRGSRYIARLRGVQHTEHYDYAKGGPENAYAAAAACWAKYRAEHVEHFTSDEQPRVFIPGDLDADNYSFTVVPVGFFSPGPDAVRYAADVAAANGDDDGTAPEEYTVTRTDYPGAPAHGAAFGWVLAAANGGHMTHPYDSPEFAEWLAGQFASDARVVRVALRWS